MWRGEFGKGDIPVLVEAGSIVPMRNMNSTYSAFTDPLVWVAWVGGDGEIATKTTLYEDAGDGLEYMASSAGNGGGDDDASRSTAAASTPTSFGRSDTWPRGSRTSPRPASTATSEAPRLCQASRQSLCPRHERGGAGGDPMEGGREAKPNKNE